MLLFRIMFRETGLHGDTYMFNSGKDSQCKLCDMYTSETATHVFFQCPSHSELRDQYWQMLHDVAPNNLYLDMREMPLDSRMSFILSCMNDTFTQEWIPVYMIILDYITRVYKARNNIIQKDTLR